MATRIKEKYLAEAIPALEEKFGYKNAMQVPRLAKIVINMGLGDCKDNAKAMEMAVNELTAIAGQKPILNRSKTAIANFKLKPNQVTGCSVGMRPTAPWSWNIIAYQSPRGVSKMAPCATPSCRPSNLPCRMVFDSYGPSSSRLRQQVSVRGPPEGQSITRT